MQPGSGSIANTTLIPEVDSMSARCFMPTLRSSNDAPEAYSDTVNVPEDVATALSPTTPIDVDDAASDLTVTLTQLPALSQGAVTYTKDGGGTATASLGVTPFRHT